jgi:hypothetical protein
MSGTRLTAKTIRAAQKEVREKFPNGGLIKGWFEDFGVDDRQVYESKIFKRAKSMFRRKTNMNQKRTPPDYFTVEPLPNSDGAGE